MKIIIGVDGGGTKTKACAYNLDGKLLGTGMSGFGNLLIESNVAISNIIESINKCLEQLPKMSECLHIYLGLAGSDNSNQVEKLEKSLKKFNALVTIVNDVRLAHVATFEGRDGILTIAGTGSVSYGISNEKIEMAGGWGHLLGDEGSGYWIAIKAIKQMIVEEDNGESLSKLSLALLNELKIKKVQEIKSFIYEASKGEIASLVPIIVQVAKSGSEEAIHILYEAGSHLGNMTVQLYRKLQLKPDVTVAMRGSILINIEHVQNAFMDRVIEEIPDVNFNQDSISATKGAYFLAMNESRLNLFL